MKLIHEAVADSSTAFAAQVETHRSYLLRAARSKLREPADADDVVQDTIVAAWKGRDAFRAQSALRTWLVGILNHKIVDLIRERQRRPMTVFDDASAIDGDDEHAMLGSATTEAASTTYERRRFCSEVLDELEAFSPKAAKIFVLREIDGEDTGAICRKLKVSSANCYVLLHRARQFLSQRFDAVPA